ncbi:DUF2911 domain-containing protein [Gillisia sp. Hel_I_29]|uniref:DUF2911 domain-containing protein n=1 Tax=Gillisia sp. Hel_I_29 TaxID=1249975 RepID=UPI0005572CF8|nr:DUF2911 domain-containing protein [Gillisia sp. Hel_I_29]
MKKSILVLFTALLALPSYAQIKSPQPSAFGKIEQTVGLTDVKIEYSRPNMKGRTIFGDLVPFGEIWRTGANSNTIISFSDDVTIEGKSLEKGTYAIYTIPNKDSWQVIFYKDSKNWGTPEKWEESKVALKAEAKVSELPFKMETFTIIPNDILTNSMVLDFVWENTAASLTINVPTEQNTMASIEKVMSGPTKEDYFAAASYYHESGKDLKQAHEWVLKATEGNNDAYWMWRRRSLIEAELGMKKEAISSANKSLDLAQKANNKDYVKMNQDSLKEWGAK